MTEAKGGETAEDTLPPDGAVIEKIAQSMTLRYPGADVGVLWIWIGGRKMLHFEWDEAGDRHCPVGKLAPEVSRVLTLMTYTGLMDEDEIPKE